MKKVIRLTESDLMRIVKRVISEESENNDEKVIEYLKSKLNGLKKYSYQRGSASWVNKDGEEIYQYHNRHFIIDKKFFKDVNEKFNLKNNELKDIFSKIFTKKFPNLKHIGIETESFPKG